MRIVFEEYSIPEVVNYTVNSIFILDIVANSRTTFINRESGELVKDPSKIAKHYFTSLEFFMDFIACLPFFLVEKYISSSQFVKLLNLTKLVKLCRIQSEVNENSKSETVKLSFKMISLVLMILVYIHLTACVFFHVINSDREWHPPQSKY